MSYWSIFADCWYQTMVYIWWYIGQALMNALIITCSEPWNLSIQARIETKYKHWPYRPPIIRKPWKHSCSSVFSVVPLLQYFLSFLSAECAGCEQIRLGLSFPSFHSSYARARPCLCSCRVWYYLIPFRTRSTLKSCSFCPRTCLSGVNTDHMWRYFGLYYINCGICSVLKPVLFSTVLTVIVCFL